MKNHFRTRPASPGTSPIESAFRQSNATDTLLLAYTNSLLFPRSKLTERLAMAQNAPLAANPETGASFLSCANCHSSMPPELRFCRNCGYRLGEGSAEFTETVRFSDGAYAPPLGGAPFGTGAGQLQPITSGQACRRKRRFSGMTWIFIAVMMVFVIGFSASFLAKKANRSVGGGFGVRAPAPPRSYFGVSGFESTDGGVTFDNVEPPGSPADLAGLVGGDVITTFDGHPIFSDSEMTGRLMETPIGKTVEVVFIRDGETKLTKLTTISKADFDQLVAIFRGRPAGQGRLGIDDQERVEIPGTKLHGVRVSVEQNKPADLAGIQAGDIIIEFEKVPIRTTEELESRIHRAVPYSTVTIAVMRGNERLEIPVKMGKR